MAAMVALLLLALPLQATAWTAAPYTALPANCGAQAVSMPMTPGCFGAGGATPTGWTCPAQPGSANGACCVVWGLAAGLAPFPRPHARWNKRPLE